MMHKERLSFLTTTSIQYSVKIDKGKKCIFSRFFHFFFQPKIYHLQDGFVRWRSCVTSLLRSTHDFVKALDEKNQITAQHLAMYHLTVCFWCKREFAILV